MFIIVLKNLKKWEKKKKKKWDLKKLHIKLKVKN